MPAVVQHLAGLVDSLRRRVGGGDARRARHRRCRPIAVSFAGPGKTDAELRQAVAAGVTIELESRDRGATASCATASELGVRPRVAIRVNPDFAGQGLRACGWAAARSSSASTPSRCPALLDELAARRRRLRRASTCSPARRTSAPRSSCEAQRKTVDLVLELAEHVPGAGALRQPRRRLRHPLLREGRAASTWPRRRQPRRAGRRTRSRPQLPDARVVIELGRYIVGECGRLRDPRRRPQGLPRADLPRRRRRHAPPAGRLRQLRPGDPAQLPDRDRQPDGRASRPSRSRGRLPVHAARPARRQGRAARAPRSAIWSCCSRPAPTG